MQLFQVVLALPLVAMGSAQQQTPCTVSTAVHEIEKCLTKVQEAQQCIAAGFTACTCILANSEQVGSCMERHDPSPPSCMQVWWENVNISEHGCSVAIGADTHTDNGAKTGALHAPSRGQRQAFSSK